MLIRLIANSKIIPIRTKNKTDTAIAVPEKIALLKPREVDSLFLAPKTEDATMLTSAQELFILLFLENAISLSPFTKFSIIISLFSSFVKLFFKFIFLL